jgi:imidazolonepropionase-like amidohydrolase
MEFFEMMRLTSRTSIVALAVALCASASASAAQSAPGATTVIRNVTVIPGTGNDALPRRDVVIEGSRITAIRPTGGRAPSGAQVIDGSGKFLTPGLVEMHVHFAPGDGAASDGAGRQLRSLLAYGVTTARALIAPPSALALRDRIAAGTLLGPTLYVAAPSLNGNSTPDTARARAAVRQARVQGYDVLKTHGGFGADVYDAIVDEARRQGLPLSGHVSAGFGLERALAARQQVEHLDGYIAASLREGGPVPGGQVIADESVLFRVDYARISALAERTAAAGAWNGFTLALFQNVAGLHSLEELQALPEMRLVPPQAAQAWSNQIAGMAGSGASRAGLDRYMAVRDSIAVALFRAGARFFVSSDSPQLFLVSGAGTLREMEAMQRAGIPAWAVVKAATADAQEYLGHRDVGTVAVGQRADLLLLDGNPLEDVAAFRERRGVMLRGRWIPAADLDRMRAEVEAEIRKLGAQ